MRRLSAGTTVLVLLLASAQAAGCLAEVEVGEVPFEPVLVVQGFPEPNAAVRVVLLRTRALWDPANFAGELSVTGSDGWDMAADTVSGAHATLVTGDGQSFGFAEVAAGVYEVPLAAYSPAPGDRLRLVVEADGRSATADTYLPRRLPNVSFEVTRRPVVRTMQVWPAGSGQRDTVYYYSMPFSVDVRFEDVEAQQDYFYFDVGVDAVTHSYQWTAGVDGDTPRSFDDHGQAGRRLHADNEGRVSARFSTGRERPPWWPFPDPRDSLQAEVVVRARLVQYGPAYARFLDIDRFPLNNETGSNVDGGLGFFGGIGAYDTTFVVTIRNGP